MAFQKDLLEEIGLTKSEINVYLALLDIGSSTTGPIVDKSQASSSKIYEILDKLIQKGLVSYIIKDGMKYFEAADPKRILDYLQEKQTKLQQQTKEIADIIPQLELKRSLSQYKSQATIYKGMKGLETAFKELLDGKGGTNYVFVVGKLDDRLNQFFHNLYKQRAAQGIKTKTIFSEAGREYYESRKDTPLFEGKVIGTTTSPATINIYGSKVNIRMGTSKEVLCVVIDNQELADSFLEQFNILWNQDVTIGIGFDAFEREWYNLFDQLKPGESYDALGAAFGIPENEEKFVTFFRKLHQARIKKNIKSRLLFKPGAEKIVEKYGMQELYKKDLQHKTIPIESEFPVEIFTGKDRAILLVQKKEPLTITIKNKEIAELFRQHFNHLWNQDVAVYRGFDAVTSQFHSMLNTLNPGEEYQVLGGSHGKGGEKLRKWFMQYHKERMEKKVHVKILANDQDYSDILSTLSQPPDTKMNLSKIKALPKEFSSPMQINLYPHGKVFIFVWGKELMCFEIASDIVYQNFQSYFQGLWHQKTTSLTGETGIKILFDDMLNYTDVWFIGGNGGIRKYYPQYWKVHNTERIKRNIIWHDLIDAKLMSNLFPNQQRRSVPYYEYKILPPELSSPHVIVFYGNKVANIIWKKIPLATIIEDKEIVEGYKKYFDYLWKSIK